MTKFIIADSSRVAAVSWVDGNGNYGIVPNAAGNGVPRKVWQFRSSAQLALGRMIALRPSLEGQFDVIEVGS